MFKRRETAERWLTTVSFLFVAAALFHVAHIFWPEPGDPSGRFRHATFVVINLVCAAALRRPPRWFWIAFAPLVVQQVISHGGAAVRAWNEHGSIDAISLVVVLVMPMTWLALWRCRGPSS